MSEIEDKLSVLNPAELAKVYKLINKLAAKHEKPVAPRRSDIPSREEMHEILKNRSLELQGATPEPKTPLSEPQTVHKIRPDKKDGSGQPSPIQNKTGRPGGPLPKRRGGTDDDTEYDDYGNPINAPVEEKEKHFSRPQPLEIPDGPRPNLFFELIDGVPLEDEHLMKYVDDKKAKPQPRRRKPAATVKVKCTGCNKFFEVSPSLVRTERWFCNRCVVRKRPR